MRSTALVLAILMGSPAAAYAEWQIKPFLSLTFAGDTTFQDVEQAADRKHPVIGANATLIGEIVGLEADVGRVLGFFQADEDPALVLRSHVTTVTGNLVLALPRRVTEYTLRPYFVGGAGTMRVRIEDRTALPTTSTLMTLDMGGGATGFLSERMGLNWDVRRFWTINGKDQAQGGSFGPEQLSFWRASMALAFRY